MAAFCRFYGMTPAEVRGLTWGEWRAFRQYKADLERAVAEAQGRG